MRHVKIKPGLALDGVCVVSRARAHVETEPGGFDGPPRSPVLTLALVGYAG
jgi:hypothetical protein